VAGNHGKPWEVAHMVCNIATGYHRLEGMALKNTDIKGGEAVR
jgi:hypothetical protein